ncbi:dTDP-glucose 4,6-dehydratase [Mucilaginibacter yixingensis]|uniref:dTDP-glucose 4,6-dehydratase n=1 Tax=Mucilaginibacter yixingensis TaxID=1295612 RepID=A0A2T5JGM8_9SPHI|nr:NAD-dependent epimerase/dehydratase family protein [Mucilaginibacter yixingensis]PTR01575.1 dTDP-glucose 4,6-dehydratase [Mucilaginibacter yixingensis]
MSTVSNKIIEADLQKIIHADLEWSRFAGKTVLITGANGFLPTYLVYTLLALNDNFNTNVTVLALVRSKAKAEAKFGLLLQRPDIKLIVQDVCDELNVNEHVHFVIHAASQASPKFYGSDPVGTLNANVQGTLNLLKLAEKHRVEKFLYFSSGEIYGVVPADVGRIKETDSGYLDPVNVRSCYAESKRLGETMCVSWMHQFHVPVSMVRIFHSYGPGMDLEDGRVFADFVADVINNRDIVMKSDGSAVRAYCYLSDATTAFFTILLNGENGHAYNMGNADAECSVVDLADKLLKLYPSKNLQVIRKEVKKEGYLKSPVHKIIPDIDKIRTLGWVPFIGIEEGFWRTIESYND